jgi:hypothetical protein
VLDLGGLRVRLLVNDMEREREREQFYKVMDIVEH